MTAPVRDDPQGLRETGRTPAKVAPSKLGVRFQTDFVLPEGTITLEEYRRREAAS